MPANRVFLLRKRHTMMKVRSSAHDFAAPRLHAFVSFAFQGTSMSQLQERIAQFRKMAADDPENELGHFRLGQLLMDDLQYTDAMASFCRTLELSPQFSKVYQLLATCLLKVERRAEAIEILQNGW